MRVLLFIALFVWNTAIRAQTAKLTDMGTYWMFKSYVSIAMPDGNFLYQYPSYMFPLPKTLKWYTEIPGKLMFINCFTSFFPVYCSRLLIPIQGNDYNFPL